MKFRIRNWSKFQHFKDRRPPWVKLYRDLLDDIEWHELDPASAKVLVMLWLIASEDDGVLPPVRKLAFRLRLSETECERILSSLSHWLEQADDTPISACHHDDAPETETETETELLTFGESSPADAVDPPAGSNSVDLDTDDGMPPCPHAQIVALYHELLPSLTRVRDWTPARQQALRARWRESRERQDLAWWRRFFEYVAKSDFLMGRKPGRNGTFECDLEWLVKSANFTKVREGKYENRA